ncbi:MAG: F0F1 ATP synthase subunit epsilon [Propionibacteriales bacterium]|nr:F0F1 ATP synthase subunit epsilon [Propionibacteriales bacterium]
MADNLQLALVAADRVVWSGEATMIIARTTDGEVGVLKNHAPLLSVLVPGAVEVHAVEGERWSAVINGGFLSVANNRVSILAEHAELADEIDVEQARRDLEQAKQAGTHTPEIEDEVRLAEAKIRVAEKAV